MADADYELTVHDYAEDEARKGILSVTGTLTGARTLRIPNRTRLYYVKNGTTGGHALTVAPISGTGVEVAQGSWSAVFCDGTNVELVDIGGTFDLGDVDRITVVASQTAFNALQNKSNSIMYLVPV